MGYIYAVRAAFIQQWQVAIGTANFLGLGIGAIPLVAMLAWIASESDDPTVLAYISVGVFLMVVWNTSVFRIGAALSGELFQGTLELNLMSRSPLMLVMLGKVLALAAFSSLTGIAAVVTVLAVSQQFIDVANVPLLLISLIFAMPALIDGGFIFTPLLVLVGGRPGFFNAILPFGVVFGGFLYPISLLPAGLQTIARFLPTSWAMDGVIRSVEGGGPAWRIAGDWGVALALTALYLTLTYFMFRKVEERVRVTGILSIS